MALNRTIFKIQNIYPTCDITFHKAMNPAHKKLPNGYKYKFDASFVISCDNAEAEITCGEFKFVQKVTCKPIKEPVRRKEGTTQYYRN